MKKLVFILALFVAGCYNNEVVEPNDGTLNSIESGVSTIIVDGNPLKVYHREPAIANGIYLYVDKSKTLYLEAGSYTEVLNPVFFNEFKVSNGIVYDLELLTL